MRYDEKTICVPDEVHEAVLQALGQVAVMHEKTGGHEKVWRKYLAAAACVALMAGMGMFTYRCCFPVESGQSQAAADGQNAADDAGAPGSVNVVRCPAVSGGQDMADGAELSNGSNMAQSSAATGGQDSNLAGIRKESVEVESTEVEYTEIETPQEINDVSVDENTYQEAHKYSDEVEEVQYAISQAMVAGELPFVIESGIYEDPVRVKVTVTTMDEASIEKVKAFDPSGSIIEIVYLDAGGMKKLSGMLE